MGEEMERPRCRVCNGFGGKDGYCGKHRPDHRKKTDFWRGNPKEPGYGYELPGGEYGVTQNFGIVK